MNGNLKTIQQLIIEYNKGMLNSNRHCCNIRAIRKQKLIDIKEYQKMNKKY